MYYNSLNEVFEAAIMAASLSTPFGENTTHKNFNKVKKESTVYLEDAGNHYVYEMPVPGLTKDAVSIKLKNNKLEITGGIEDHKWSPLFTNTFSLPKNADLKTVKANVENGILCIKIDKDKEFETTIKVV
jgi:HSP20 family molecular chaperone IbpA